MMRYKIFCKKTLVCVGLFTTLKAHAISILNHLQTPSLTQETTPWFTGPLLAPSAHTIPPGHINVEPYIYFFVSQGIYNQNKQFKSLPNFYTLLEQASIQIGLNSFLDCQITPQLFYQFSQGERSVQPGDLPIGLNILLLNDSPGTHCPAIKLSIATTFPFGKFEQLSATKHKSDGVGSGSWMPQLRSEERR